MGAGDLITGPWQVEVGGLLMGDGTPYNLVSIAGLGDLPAIRNADAPRPMAEGLFAGVDWLGERTVNLSIDVTTGSAFEANLAAFLAATGHIPASQPASQSVTLCYQLPGETTRQIACRARKRASTYDLQAALGFARFDLQYLAHDPRLYSYALHSATIPVSTTPGGFGFNLGFNFGFGTAGTVGSQVLTNAGNYPTKPVAVISGPVDNPTLQNVTSGQSVSFAISLTASDTLTLDFDAHTVMLDSTGSRRGTMLTGSQWWELAPGTNTVLYTANTVQVGSTVTLTWRDAWI